MDLILDPVEDRPHHDWLQTQAGAYEWWYFDAVSEDGLWSLVSIWFLGNPFSPYTRAVSRGLPADPYEANAVFFALSRGGLLYAYHFTQFPASELHFGPPLRFGPNTLMLSAGLCRLSLSDQNANGRSLAADFTLAGAPLTPRTKNQDRTSDHFWLPALPAGRFTGTIRLRESRNHGGERIEFVGSGYHDHNWGRLPFRESWVWARADLGEGNAAVLYHFPDGRGGSRLLLFERGALIYDDPAAMARGSQPSVNAFGTIYPTRFGIDSGGHRADFRLTTRLDSAPFYVRTQCRATVDGRVGRGIGEYFRPRGMDSALAASAMRARIVQR